MPSVGGRRFAYSPKGQKQAAAFARKTGQLVKTKDDNPRDSATTERAERKRGIKT